MSEGKRDPEAALVEEVVLERFRNYRLQKRVLALEAALERANELLSKGHSGVVRPEPTPGYGLETLPVAGADPVAVMVLADDGCPHVEVGSGE